MKNLYQEITDKIISQLESNVIPWHKPWIVKGDNQQIVSHSTGKPYSLLNMMLLSQEGEFATFKQIQAEGGKVKKGAKATPIYFWKMLPVDKKDADGKPVVKNGKVQKELIPLLKYYNVFNILTEVEGIEPKYYKKAEIEKPSKAKKRPKAEVVISDYVERAKLRLVNNVMDRAFYSPSRHLVQVPPIASFKEGAEYYSTMFHELTHSTGHSTLLNRFKNEEKVAAFGSCDYSKEELVAEIGAATSLTMLKIDTNNAFNNSVAYIKGWLKSLKNDPKMIVGAASRAEKAVNLIFNIETKKEGEEEE